MNKRIAKKIQKAATVRDFTLQEAWDKVCESLAQRSDYHCLFIGKERSKIGIHSAGSFSFLLSSRTVDEMNKYMEDDTNIFKCQECGKNITIAEDVDYAGYCESCAAKETPLTYCTAEGCLNDTDPDSEDGLCTAHMEKQLEEWEAELNHQDYEYKQSKI